jgi:dienelactone hydrolase
MRRIFGINWLVLGFLISGALFASSRGFSQSERPASPSRLSRTNLLVYHDKNGEPKRVSSRAEWQKRRAEILRGMQQIMGPLPGNEKRCPLDARTEEEVDSGSYVRRLISYASEPGGRVPAYLLIPKTALQSKNKLPGVLALHPTDMEFGHRVVVEELRASYRAYARDLAERGFVVLAPAYPLMAKYQPDLKALGYQSGTMKAIWDNIRGLDYLESLPFVKRGKFGAIGHSLGGHNAIYTAVFDERIKVMVSSCGFDSFVDYMDGNIKGWTSERYMPKLWDYKDRSPDIPFDFHELIGALAPRRLLICAPMGDTNFKWRSVDQIVAAARPIFRLYGRPEYLQAEHPEGGHDFSPAMREEAYRLLEKEL